MDLDYDLMKTFGHATADEKFRPTSILDGIGRTESLNKKLDLMNTVVLSRT